MDTKPFNPPRVIETDHLWLRPLTESDAFQLYHALFGDPRVTEWLPIRTFESVDRALHEIHKWQHGWETGSLYSWVLEDKQTGRFCAMIELRPMLPRIELGVVTTMRDEYKRRRAGLVALRKVINWVLDQPGVCRIYAGCAPEGDSAPVMEKLGFKLEGLLKNWEARPNIGLAAADSLMYSLTREPRAEDVDLMKVKLKRVVQVDEQQIEAALAAFAM